MKNGMFGRIASSLTAFLLALFALPNCVATASDAVLLDFSSAHCGPCRAMHPVLTQLEQQGVPVRHVDVNKEPNLASRYGIRQTPTFVVVSSGKEVTRLVGMQSAAELLTALAINPQGPLVATGANLDAGQPVRAPQTRLAPLRRANFEQTLAAAPASNARGRDSHQREPMPSLSLASAIERASAATVRLKVHDGTGYGAGTGTIIDTHGESALVLTCGHLFRENKGQGKIEVDLFVGGQVKTVMGKIVDYDAENRDIALVEILPGFVVQPVPVLAAGQTLRTGQPVFSFGCDRGDDPTRRDTRITGVDKYDTHLGASNIEISGAPVDGRSGGGLFDDQGRLVGVCNAADYKDDLGIYTGPGSVQWQLDRVGLSNLYKAPSRMATQSPTSPPANRIAAVMNKPNRNSVVQASAIAPVRQPSNVAGDSRSAIASGNREVIVIVRDRNDPTGEPQVMTLRQPTAGLMEMIERQAR
ncbi:trypsin-like peptidase domain-containing protein [Stieleria marina]|uniref:Thioredoxin n=1 Tax=Stieleria marina TaxID=1930275 RepID=A0A517NML7_9BACT|nr:Thioredoxin [Planctomycetes bacterium K23_9]